MYKKEPTPAPIIEEEYRCSECGNPFLRSGRFWHAIENKLMQGIPVFCSPKCKKKHNRKYIKKLSPFKCTTCNTSFSSARYSANTTAPTFCSPNCRNRYIAKVLRDILKEDMTIHPFPDYTNMDIEKIYPNWQISSWPKKWTSNLIVILRNKTTKEYMRIRLPRLLMEYSLGRKLLFNEKVHYLDGNNYNLAPENLYIKIIKGPVLDRSAKTNI